MARFHGMTRFTIVDFNKGYWMVELDPESRKYTTMALDIGRFQWTRLPMGSIVSQDVFQRKLNTIFLDIPGVTGIADDMVIYGKTDLEHDRHLINFLNICRKNTLMLNPDKMQFRLPQVSFFGHQWSAKGLSPDPKKIAAVRRMDLPGDVETMRSFLGLVNYLNRFSPHLAELSEPLREICRQDTEFQLTKSVCVAFLKTKEEISKKVTLPYFNPRSDTTLQTDASKKGLGALILQDSRPVMFASRALTGAEKNYLVIRDYFSKYLIARRLPNSSTHAVIKELGLVFTELGRLFVLRSDNGPCYSSREFHNFLSFYQVDHITSRHTIHKAMDLLKLWWALPRN